MKQALIIIICILFSFLGFAQGTSFTVTISDSLSNELLPFATVYLKNTGIGTTTGIDGIAKINFKEETDYVDTLICSYIGYHQKEISLDLRKINNLKISLSSSSTHLDEVVVVYKKPLTTKQILKKAIKNTADNYSNVPVYLNGFYRETMKEADKNIYLNEGVVKIHYTKYPQNKLDRNSYKTWLYDDEYAFESGGAFREFSEFPTHFNTSQDKVKLIEARSSANWSNYFFDYSIRGGALSLTSKDFIKYRYDFLNPKNFSKYNYLLKENEFVNNRSCYVLRFYPKPSSKRMIFDYSKKLKRSIYVGKLYIDIHSFAVVKMEFQLAKNVDFGFYGVNGHVPLDDILSVNYQEKEGFWYLQNISRTKIRGIKTKFSEKKILYTGYQNLTITGLDNKPTSNFTNNEIWKHTRLTTLRKKEVPFNADFWAKYEKEEYPVLPEKIKLDLEHKTSLDQQFKERFKQKENLPSPIAKKTDFVFDYPLEKIDDDYHWMADSVNQIELYRHLKEENIYTDNYLIPYKKYQKSNFNSLNNFFSEDTIPVIHKKGDFVYDKDSLENTILYEYSDSIHRTAIFHFTHFKEARENCFVSSVMPYQNMIGVTYSNNAGLNNFTIILNKSSLTVLDSISNVSTIEFFNKTSILYTRSNTFKRSDKLFSRNILSKKDSLILFVEDLTYDVSVSKSKNYIICSIESKDESEIHLIKKNGTISNLQLIKARQVGIQYSIKEFDNTLYMMTNEEAINNRILKFVENEGWKEIVSPSKDAVITDFIVTDNYFVLHTFKNSFTEIKYKRKDQPRWNQIDFKTKIFNANIQAFNGDKIKVFYSNPSTPFRQLLYDLPSKNLTKLKETKIKRNVNPKYFKTERLWAKSQDGTKVPITLTYIKTRRSKKIAGPLILKAYGAYGNFPLGNSFNKEDAVLLNDGFAIAYAHVRGGIGMGTLWYHSGKLLNKENSFNDYITCAEYLIEKEYTTSSQLIGYGNSAGGLIMGVVINRRPELFNTVVLDHAFVDALTVMMDDTNPLTTDEYKEWGNPNEKETYNYIKAYSPFQNTKKQKYPNLLFTAGANDYQTPAWQIAKFVAKIKEDNTGDNTILFKTDFDGGHRGNPSDIERLKNASFINAFIYGNIFE